MMAQAKPKLTPKSLLDPFAEQAAGYETDFYLWSCEQAELLRQRRFTDIDLANIVEEIESLGRSDRRALISAYRVLIQHLLKWQFRPQKRSKAWENTIAEQRDRIELLERESPSLAVKLQETIAEAYGRARTHAARETGLSMIALPVLCPYRIEHLRDEDWLRD